MTFLDQKDTFITKVSSKKEPQMGYYSLHVLQNGVIFPFEMKKCCKKYKKGKRCKKCPAQ